MNDSSLQQLNLDKMTEYWVQGAEEDWEVAQELLSIGRTRHGLFLVHLALEKLLKAHACTRTREIAPRIHNLVRLAEIAELVLSDENRDLLAEINAFNVEARYPERYLSPPTGKEASAYLTRAAKVFRWLKSQL